MDLKNSEELEKLIESKEDIYEKVSEEYERIENQSKGWWAKFKEFFSDRKNQIIAALIILGLMMAYNSNKETIQETVIEPVKDKAALIMKDDLEVNTPKGNVLFIDLDQMDVTKVVESVSTKTNKERVGVWYRLEEEHALYKNISHYITIFEDKDNMKHNGKAYLKYVEEQQKKIQEETKVK